MSTSLGLVPCERCHSPTDPSQLTFSDAGRQLCRACYGVILSRQASNRMSRAEEYRACRRCRTVVKPDFDIHVVARAYDDLSKDGSRREAYYELRRVVTGEQFHERPEYSELPLTVRRTYTCLNCGHHFATFSVPVLLACGAAVPIGAWRLWWGVAHGDVAAAVAGGLACSLLLVLLCDCWVRWRNPRVELM